jgi:hypothetical protein
MKESDWKNWANELKERATNWLANEAEKTPKGYFCRSCGEYLRTRIIYCSIHENGEGEFSETHVGGGEVRTLKIPECPNNDCPNHRPSFWDEHLQLDGNTLRGPCIDY